GARWSCLPRGTAVAHARPAVARSAGVSADVGRGIGYPRYRTARRLVGTRLGRGAPQGRESLVGAAAVRRPRPRGGAVPDGGAGRPARDALRVAIRSAAAADPGRVRLA